MAEEGFEYHEMDAMGKKYPEYDMNYEQLDYEYNHIQDLLRDGQKIKNDEENREYTKRSEYLLKLICKKEQETSFIGSDDGKKVLKLLCHLLSLTKIMMIFTMY